MSAITAVALLAGCAAPADGPSPTQRLRALIAAGDYLSADALIATNPAELDTRRALDLAIRGGHVAAVRHFVAATGPDVDLDPDGSTPLIRAVLDAPGPSRVELVALLVGVGADPGRVDRYGRGPIDYATTRNRIELLALLDPASGPQAGRRGPSFVDWLGAGVVPADPTGARAASAADPAGRRASDAAPRGLAAVTPPTASLLLRRSPWRPASAADPRADRAALRFHADGALDVLRQQPGAAEAVPMADAFGAWRLDADGALRLAIVGPAFDVACLGPVDPATGADAASGRTAATPAAPSSRTAAAPPAASGRAAATPVAPSSVALATSSAAAAPAAPPRRSRPAGEPAPGDRLALACEELPPPVHGSGYSLDRARAMLDSAGAAHEPSVIAIASGRVPLPGESRADDASHGSPQPTRALVSLAGSAPLSACRPARARPRVPIATHRVLGDWHALDVRRFESRAPTSGALCPQTAARDAAMAACRASAGRDAAACRSVGGCPAGQASVVAGLPGVDAGWIGCAADPAVARRRALDACRADLGCDCQVAAFSGRNLLHGAGGATCTAPRR